MAGTGFSGPIEEWREHLDRIAAMGFGAVIIAPPFRPGASGDLFLTADHDRLDPRLGTGDAVEALGRWAQAAVSRGLRPMLDLVVDRVATEATENGAADWYRSDTGDEPPDPRRAPREPGVAPTAGRRRHRRVHRRLERAAGDVGRCGHRRVPLCVAASRP